MSAVLFVLLGPVHPTETAMTKRQDSSHFAHGESHESMTFDGRRWPLACSADRFVIARCFFCPVLT